ncbi:MAG: hypothetical protein AAFO74_12925 [Pseudomonadota bacterium]
MPPKLHLNNGVAVFASSLEVLDHHSADLLVQLITQTSKRIDAGRSWVTRFISVREELNDADIIVGRVNVRVVKDQHKNPTKVDMKRPARIAGARAHRKHFVPQVFYFLGRSIASKCVLFLFGFLFERFGTIFANVNKNRLKNKHLVDSKANISVCARSTVGKCLSTELSTGLPVPITSIDGGY